LGGGGVLVPEAPIFIKSWVVTGAPDPLGVVAAYTARGLDKDSDISIKNRSSRPHSIVMVKRAHGHQIVRWTDRRGFVGLCRNALFRSMRIEPPGILRCRFTGVREIAVE